MTVSGQAQALAAERGPRARMQRHMLATAIRQMQDGLIPSVSDVAEAAEVSRATAYRYFPSQAAMVQAVVDEALGPILEWKAGDADPEGRAAALLGFAFPRMLEYEATHRAALAQALDQWARRQAGTLGDEARIVRGNRKGLLVDALTPLRRKLGPQAFDNLAQSLSLIFGIEAIIVLKDIWGLHDRDVRRLALWAADALVRTAISDAAAAGPAAERRRRERGAKTAGARSRHRKQ